MKQILLLAILLAFSGLSIQAQTTVFKPAKQIDSTWDNNTPAWVFADSVQYTYNASGKVTLKQTYTNASPIPDKTVYLYNVKGDVTSDTSYTLNGPVYTYVECNTYTYDGNNHQTQLLNQAWNSTGSVWENTSSINDTWIGGQITTTVNQNWNNGVWGNLSKQDYFYSNNVGEYFLFSIWNNGNWDTGGRVNFVWLQWNGAFNNSQPSSYIQQVLNGTVWDDIQRTTLSYDPLGNCTDETMESKTASMWVQDGGYKYNIQYDVDGNRTQDINQQWIDATIGYRNYSKRNYSDFVPFTVCSSDQPGAISGNISVTPATSETYSVTAVAGATSYNWTLPSGWSGTSTSNTITVTTGTTSGAISVSAVNGCGTSSPTTLMVNQAGCVTNQPGSISGNTSVTPATSETYSVTAVVDATSYTWTLPSGWSGTSTNNTITVTTGTTSGAITVSAVYGCGTSPLTTLTVNQSNPVSNNNQDWVWAKSTGVEYQGYAMDIATDALGNSYITGVFSSSTITFGAITLNKVSASSGADVFIAKYDASGNALWAKNASILTSYAPGSSIAIATDVNNNVFITGAFNVASANFGGAPLTHSSSNGNNKEIFIVKYDSQGTLLWAKDVDYEGIVWMYDIATDSQGNAIITGSYSSNPLTFGSTLLPAYSNTNPFMAKFDASGNVVWAKGAQQTAGNASTVWNFGIATDASDNIYIVGDYVTSSSLNFDGLSLPVCSGRNMYIVKYDDLGNALWAKASVGTSYSGYQSAGYNITADLNGNIIVTGYFGSTTIGFGNITLTNSNSNTSSDIFVVKYDSSGNALWAKNAGGMGDDAGHKIASDNYGNSYVTGYFKSKPASFGSFTIDKDNGSSPRFFVIKYDNLGNEVWVKYIEQTDAYGGGLMTNGVAADDFGNVYVTGNAYDSHSYNGSAVFGNTTLTYGGIFIAKLGDVPVIPVDPVEIEKQIHQGQTFVIYPNPANHEITIKVNSDLRPSTFVITDQLGVIVINGKLTGETSNVNISELASGIYLLQVEDQNFQTLKVIKN